MTGKSGLLAIYAHPDDESFSMGGVAVLLTELGVPVTIVSATRGEVGDISDDRLATRETLPEVREAELRQAMETLGVSDIRFMGYRDSGMLNTEPNNHPDAFINAPLDDLVASIAALVAELEPAIVVTFGPDGLYGHPDHLQIHQGVAETFRRMDSPARPALYYSSVPRNRLIEMAAILGGPFRDMSLEDLNRMGMPVESFTTMIDVSDVQERKMQAMKAHLTQFGEDGPLATIPDELRQEIISREHFVQVSFPGSVNESDPLAEMLRDYLVV